MTRSHGLSKHPLYSTWCGMKNRCLRKYSSNYKWYGGRGITVCGEWLEFLPFYEWAIANGWQEGLTLEREDPDGPYAPGNCTWIPLRDQAKNTRSNLRITAFGETKILADWVRDPRSNGRTGLISARLQRGWDAERAITEPPRPGNYKR